jgi:hypothetical protein
MEVEQFTSAGKSSTSMASLGKAKVAVVCTWQPMDAFPAFSFVVVWLASAKLMVNALGLDDGQAQAHGFQIPAHLLRFIWA